jgi:hypothetical protein
VWVTGGDRRRVKQENPPMRIYIIGNDGITLCHEAPATVNEGEIAVASNDELQAAPLSGKRLLALWNALPGVEKRRNVGDREALIDQLWSAIEALPGPTSARRTCVAPDSVMQSFTRPTSVMPGLVMPSWSERRCAVPICGARICGWQSSTAQISLMPIWKGWRA